MFGCAVHVLHPYLLHTLRTMKPLGARINSLRNKLDCGQEDLLEPLVWPRSFQPCVSGHTVSVIFLKFIRYNRDRNSFHVPCSDWVFYDVGHIRYQPHLAEDFASNQITVKTSNLWQTKQNRHSVLHSDILKGMKALISTLRYLAFRYSPLPICSLTSSE